MKIPTFAVAILIGVLTSTAIAGDVQTATGAITLESATDKTEPILSSSGELPGRDVSAFAVSSDGSELRLAATLAETPSGAWADAVVRMFVDTDDDATTGAAATFTDVSGFEFQIDLNLCVKYENGVVACAGQSGTQVASYFAVAVIKNTASGAEVTSLWDLPETPVEGKVVAAPVPYRDLGVKSGQTIRFYAREGDGPMDASSYFPEVKLTLK